MTSPCDTTLMSPTFHAKSHGTYGELVYTNLQVCLGSTPRRPDCLAESSHLPADLIDGSGDHSTDEQRCSSDDSANRNLVGCSDDDEPDDPACQRDATDGIQRPPKNSHAADDRYPIATPQDCEFAQQLSVRSASNNPDGVSRLGNPDGGS